MEVIEIGTPSEFNDPKTCDITELDELEYEVGVVDLDLDVDVDADVRKCFLQDENNFVARTL